eukprot:TRINITY_DN696_c0_g1_i2.p1 TRINITY_DN696_c0_g1~~TRINITY_DN696_c0_g1_i2.p1  ORF type:complete len:382 (-),score=111.94 TRINITY_DN696_c0_g1_i2:451-1596(-)
MTCIIIGGGLSGLIAALRLADENRPVVLLEARQRLGGRIHTVVECGSSVDLGASWIHGWDGNPLTSLAEQFGVALSAVQRADGVSFEAPRIAYDADGRRVPDAIADAVDVQLERWKLAATTDALPTPESDISIREALRTHGGTALLDALRSQLGAQLPSTAEPRGYLERLFDYKLAAWEGWNAGTVEQISLRYYGEFGSHPGGDRHVTGGYGAIVAGLVAQLRRHPHATLLTGHVVDHVECVPGSGTVVVHGSRLVDAPAAAEPAEHAVPRRSPNPAASPAPSTNRFTVQAAAAIVTVPLGVLKAGSITFSPPLPAPKTLAIERLGYGAIEKVVLVFNEHFWGMDHEWITFAGNVSTDMSLYLNMSFYRRTPLPLLVGFAS